MKKILTTIILSMTLVSCTSVPPQKIQYVPTLPPNPQIIMPQIRSDVCHVVAPLETVWRLSKMYDVTVESIIKRNNLNSNGDIEKGQRLVIPNAAKWKPVIPLYPSRKWKYIIIHHSATDYGNALVFDKAHINRGWDGLGYDFVIDNGTESKKNGQIEVSPRWIKQKNGAHCKASNMNEKGIGVCLVGDYTTSYVSDAQLDSLVFLVNKLRLYYGIPVSNIIGHGQVPGANTACPGRNFPWTEFRKRLYAK